MVEMEVGTDLPAGIIGEPSNLHTMNSAARARGLSFVVAGKSPLALTRASSKLYSETLAQEVGSMKSRHNVARVHWVLVFDEAESIHELDLGYLSGSVGSKVRLQVRLGGALWQIAQVKPGGRDLGGCHGSGKTVPDGVVCGGEAVVPCCLLVFAVVSACGRLAEPWSRTRRHDKVLSRGEEESDDVLSVLKTSRCREPQRS